MTTFVILPFDNWAICHIALSPQLGYILGFNDFNFVINDEIAEKIYDSPIFIRVQLICFKSNMDSEIWILSAETPKSL